MREFPTATTVEVITQAERNAINGRFATVGRGDDWLVLGCVGSLWAHDLNRRQRDFLASVWCFAESNVKYSYEILESYPDSTLPPANFNNFIKFTKL